MVLVKIIIASDRIVSRKTQSGSDGSKHGQCDNVGNTNLLVEHLFKN